MANKVIRLAESEFHNVIKESVLKVLSETSPYLNGTSYVKSLAEIEKLKNMLKNGQKTMKKGDKTISVQHELERKLRQNQAFSNRFAGDLDMELNKRSKDYYNRLIDEISKLRKELKFIQNLSHREFYDKYGTTHYKEDRERFTKEKLSDAIARLNKLRNENENYDLGYDDEYGFRIMKGGYWGDSKSFSSPETSDFEFWRNDNKTVNDASKMRDVTDAMAGYYDELTNNIGGSIDSLNKEKGYYDQYYNELNSYNNDKQAHQQYYDNVKKQQRDYDKQPFYKKWFNKRPSDPKEFEGDKPWLKDANGNWLTQDDETIDRSYDKINQRIKNMTNMKNNHREKLANFRDKYNKNSQL